MLTTFNCGVGFVLVVKKEDASKVIRHVSEFYDCYEIGHIKTGPRKIEMKNKIQWH